MELIGKNLVFKTIHLDEKEHQDALIAFTSNESVQKYLGNTLYVYSNEDTVTGNDYFATLNDNIIGYLGLGHVVDTPYGESCSIYYGVFEQYYGRGYGKMMLEDIQKILRENTSIRLLIADVNIHNQYSIQTVSKAGFVKAYEDDEDYQFHKYLKKCK